MFSSHDVLSLRALGGVLAIFIIWQACRRVSTAITRRRIIASNGCKPARKYAHKEPFLGLDLVRETIKLLKAQKFVEGSRQRLRDYDTFTLEQNLVGKRVFQTAEPENFKAALNSKMNDYSVGDRRKAALIPILGEGIFASDGEVWKHSRAMLRPNFDRSQVGDLDSMERHVRHLIEAIPRDGSTLDLQPLFYRLTIDTATEFLFGESTNSLTSSDNIAFADAFDDLQLQGGKEVRLGGLARWMRDSTYKRDQKTVHDFADKYVHRALDRHRRKSDLEKNEKSREDDRYIFLDEVVKQTQDPIRIRSELLNVLMAGRDTTAGLLSILWFQLARKPEIWKKLRAEVDGLGGERPTYEQVRGMKYLKMVINETLRRYPIVPAYSRTALRDTVLPVGGGPDGKSPLLVPAGSNIQLNMHAMHTRPDIYGADADDFRPERWAENLRPGWGYIPFSGGPRVCLGQQLALTEASYATIRLMQEFKGLESRDEGDWVERLNLTMSCGNGTKVALTPA